VLLRTSRRLHIAALLVTVLAISVRVYWVFKVQTPFDAIYSDMQGYYDRSMLLLDRSYGGEKRVLALYPFGTHYVFGAEFYAFGRTKNPWIPLLHAVYSGTFAYPFMMLARRFVGRNPRPIAMTLALGLIAALWQPCVWFVGFFISEVPFFPLLYWNLLFALNFVERRRHGFAFGLSSAVLFVIRPQVIVSTGLVILLFVWLNRRRLRGFLLGLFRLRLRAERAVLAALRFAAPFLLVLTFSASRHKRLTGHWGLISENGTMNRVFSDTPIAKLEAHWLTQEGAQFGYWFQPPTKYSVGESEEYSFTGYIAEAEILNRIRAKYTSRMTTRQRVMRALRNVTLLWDRNNPWPEQGRMNTAFRVRIQRDFNQVLRWFILPASMIGLLCVRKNARFFIVLFQLLTLVFMSMLFFPEARYRTPYDPLLLMLAGCALASAVRWVHRRLTRRRLTSVVAALPTP
jgi:hypothetical protein